ncbi:MAG: PAS domain-containing protein [Candidatus Thermoplasmatota archaeon]|nr:PAS domain-containing protein [Candidatus Thermoplasmatota archaeon]
MTPRKKDGGKKIQKKIAKASITTDENESGASFPIVGMGASAGGLEAVTTFFKHITPDTGMAFVLVTHLDPSHASGMPEILQRVTPMPVLEADDGVTVMPNHVYLIPPGRHITVFKGTLQIRTPDERHGQRMPIDLFFRSLAQEQGEDAICIIFSGGGSDGTFGLQAIHGAGGASFVQDPSTAKYESMPMSAISSGLATFVVPIDQMAEQVMAYSRDVFGQPKARPIPAKSRTDRTEYDGIIAHLKDQTGHDFSMYKSKMILRRIKRRMDMRGIKKIGEYHEYLKKKPDEIGTLVGDLLINVTNFFRNPNAFDVLKKDILPRLLDAKPEGYEFRVWVVGCATGEEAYSIAIVLKEYMEENNRNFNMKIYGTDINEQSIATARKGLYLPNIAIDVSPDRLQRFFVKDDEGYRIRRDIRDMVVFAVQDILKDPPFTRLDLTSCRNLLIYLEPDTQSWLISALHYATRPGGVLFLGPSEGIGNLSNLLTPINKRWKLYQTKAIPPSFKTMPAHIRHWTAFKSAAPAYNTESPPKESNIAELTRTTLLKSFAPPAVLTDESGNIIYVYGETGKYLRPPPGHLNLNVSDMACEGIQHELRKAIKDSVSLKKIVVMRDRKVKLQDRTELVDITVRPITEHEGAPIMLMITFQSTQPIIQSKKTPPEPIDSTKRYKQIEELQQELSQTRINLQETIERYQASNEELMSTNEEYLSTNEELQSTNEELQTSQEELQSVNEELVMVNSELAATNENLRDTQNDLKNLFDNTYIGTIFLDDRLILKWFNQGAQSAFRLVPSDTGRPLANIKSILKSEDLVLDARRVLQSLEPMDKEVETVEGQWLLARIRPYRTLEDSIGGVVLTLTDITDLRHAKELSEESRIYAEGIVNTLRESLIVLDSNLRVMSVNDAYCRTFKTTNEAVVGNPIYAIGDGHWNIPEIKELLEEVLPGQEAIEGVEVEIDTPSEGQRRMLLNLRRIVEESGTDRNILVAAEDITEKKMMEQALNETNRKLQLMTGITRHDIKGQLTIVEGNLELSRTVNDRNKAARLINNAIEAVRKMDAMIEFTREYQDIGCKEPTWQSLRSNLQDAIAKMTEHGIRIEVDVPNVEIFADPLLPKVFYNLAMNSVSHGERTTVIRFKSENDGNDLKISCEDDGAGIPVEEKAKIFERGYGKHTGLGLFYSAEICSITGLEIKECGEMGVGAKFVISVPQGKWRNVNPA